jgi:hypothetical protein
MAPTTAKLRHDISRGRAGDKVDVIDPAAAPLGTDEEAAGTPPSPSAIEKAHRQEVRSSPVTSERHDSDHAIAIYLVLLAIVFANVGLALWLA